MILIDRQKIQDRAAGMQAELDMLQPERIYQYILALCEAEEKLAILIEMLEAADFRSKDFRADVMQFITTQQVKAE